jgi:hypothetical protein
MPADYHNNTNGHPRLCPYCRKQVSTTRGKFDIHTVPGSPHISCAGSGKSVKQHDKPAAPEQAALFAVLD